MGNRVSGAPFPFQPPSSNDKEVTSGWSVPTGSFVPGTPTPFGTSAQEAPIGDPNVTFNVNNGFQLNDDGVTGSTFAEPSGATGGGVVLISANWLAAYSTDGGNTFTPLYPTLIFPPFGFCCDQIVQYVPSIDRFIWLLEGNGMLLAAASPAGIMSSNGTAWWEWRLTPDFFGQPNGTSFDYPDLSVGTNYLYASWTTHVPTPGTTGLQVIRIPLGEIQAGGTIHVESTKPSDSAMAGLGHLSQNTQDEIFWAGHNKSGGSQSMRVFSAAEGSRRYFWRDIGISSWANNKLSSTTPDNQNWLATSPGNFHAITGATRSSNQIWFAWSAGTDNNFQQPHVELVALDRNNDFSVISQEQIWNDSYAFAMPALATNACTGEIGLSLEYGGNGNYENHVVGFWGDFVVYITTNSNVGTTRFGDYVTIRQDPTPGLDGAFFDAFGYGLNTVPTPGSGSQSDIRHVVFGRGGACAPG